MASSQGTSGGEKIRKGLTNYTQAIKKGENGGTCETMGFSNLVTIRTSIECYIYQC